MSQQQSTATKNKSFLKSFKFLIVSAQVFGLFPVQGLFSDSLKFTWKSLFLIIWFIPSGLGGWFSASSHIRNMIVNNFDTHDMNNIVFNFSNGCYCFFFMILSRDWPEIVKEWQKAEISLEKYGWPRKIDFRLKLTATVFFILEAFEHLTVQINKLIVAFQCKDNFDKSLTYFFKDKTFPHIFSYLPYNHFLGLGFQILNSRLAFCWTYVDLFILLICMFFTARFHQITQRVKEMTTTETSIKDWKIVRQDYSLLCNLCHMFDAKLWNLVLLSFATNMYFIIFHLYRSLNERQSPLETVYFAISFGLLILRVIGVCWWGGKLHEETRAPFRLLLSVPERFLNVEIERFVERIQYEAVGITGRKFFIITRSLIIKIANVIVTYELILIQFIGISVQEVSIYSSCE